MFIFSLPLIVGAQTVPTVEEQYQSALREVIVLLQQQVAILIEQLNALQTQTQKTDPIYTYTTIIQSDIIVPDMPKKPTSTITEVTPNLGAETPSLYNWETVLESENSSEYKFTNNATTSKQYTSVTVRISPKIIVNTFDQIIIRTYIGSNPGSDEYIITKPTIETDYIIPMIRDFQQSKTTDFRIEVNAYEVSNANDRYNISLISFQ